MHSEREGSHRMIEIHDLSRTYGTVKAVDRVTLTIEKGEVFGLLGPNGAGKTTLIKMLTLLSRPDSGTCTVSGFDASHPSEIKRLIGVMPQENNLDRELTARENLLIYGMLHGLDKLDLRIEATLEMVGLRDRKDSVVSHFSGGMQRRLLLGRALMTEPAVVFLDEPSIGLDPQLRRQTWDLIRKARIDGRTVVITTHYIEEAEILCDRVAVLSKGRLIALDSPAGLKTRVGEYVVEFVNEEGRLVQHMCRTRAEAQEGSSHIENGVTIRRSNLEDVFIELTGERLE
jgi:ABC-2 type transport system ATP-binding protein